MWKMGCFGICKSGVCLVLFLIIVVLTGLVFKYYWVVGEGLFFLVFIIFYDRRIHKSYGFSKEIKLNNPES